MAERTALPDNEFFEFARRRMVESQLRLRGIRDQRVLDAMLKVPRHQFVPERYWREAYDDHPLPIGEGQTISQPYIVAIMLESLALRPEEKALEVGTGSGYATALLGELAAEVFSMERHPALAAEAQRVLDRLGYKNVRVFAGDGKRGFPEAAPYNAILVSAAAPELPRPLVEQLAEGGRMMIPVGLGDAQQLQLLHVENGEVKVSLRELCRFVPLVEGTSTD